MRFWGEAREQLFTEHCLYSYQHAKPPPIGDLGAGISWEVASSALIERCFSGEPAWIAKLHAMLNRGATGVLVLSGDVWAAMSWASAPDSPSLPQIPGSFQRGAHWFFAGHTNPLFRGLGLFKLSSRVLVNELFAQHGSPEIRVDVLPHNIPARHAAVALGLSELGMLGVYYLWIPRLLRYPLLSHWRPDKLHPALLPPESAILAAKHEPTSTSS